MEYNNIVGPQKSWKIKVLFDRLLMYMMKQGQCEIERSNYTAQTAIISVDIRVCVC